MRVYTPAFLRITTKGSRERAGGKQFHFPPPGGATVHPIDNTNSVHPPAPKTHYPTLLVHVNFSAGKLVLTERRRKRLRGSPEPKRLLRYKTTHEFCPHHHLHEEKTSKEGLGKSSYPRRASTQVPHAHAVTKRTLKRQSTHCGSTIIPQHFTDP